MIESYVGYIYVCTLVVSPNLLPFLHQIVYGQETFTTRFEEEKMKRFCFL